MSSGDNGSVKSAAQALIVTAMGKKMDYQNIAFFLVASIFWEDRFLFALRVHECESDEGSHFVELVYGR